MLSPSFSIKHRLSYIGDGGEILNKKRKVLIANTGEDTLTYLDLKNGKTISTIDLKMLAYSYIGPYDLLSTDGEIIYCTNIYDNSLYKININNERILDTIYIGSYPTCIRFFKNYFYIVNTDSNSISVVDSKKFSLVENIPVGEKPIDMEIDEINGRLYIANSNSRSISIIDLQGNENFIIDLKNNPLKLILQGKKMYILSNVSNSPISKSNISLLDLDSLEEKKFTELDGIFNTMVKINSSEIVFSTNIDNGILYRMDIEGRNILSKTNLLGLPNKLVWDGYRTLYITNLSDNILTLFDTEINKVIENFKVGKEPNGILLLD